MERLFAIALAALPLAASAEDYYGILRVPAAGPPTLGAYSFASTPPPLTPPTLAENGYRLKLGYKYSRYLAVEGEFSDFARTSDPFTNPASLASAFRSTGFGVDTVATLPVWRFSFYGRMGAYHGDRNTFGGYSTTLLGDPGARGTRWRYGLGMRYDFTSRFGIRAELERYAQPGLGSPWAGDVDNDQLTVGVSWRF